MRRSKALGAASAAALVAGSFAVSGVFGSSHREAPKILKDPTADNTDVYAFTATDAPGSLTIVANWIPLADPAGGPNFGPLDRGRQVLRQDRQLRRRPRGRCVPLGLQDQVPQPELVPLRRSDGRRRSTIRTSTWSRRTTSTSEEYNSSGKVIKTRSGSPTTLPVVPDNVGPKTIPNFARGRSGRRHPAQGRRQDHRRPVRRPVLRRPRRGLRRHQHRQAGPPEHRPRQPGRRQGRRRGLQHQGVRAAGARARGHARRQVRSRA